MYRYLCGCDLWTVGHEVVLEHVPSLPLSPYFFHQSVIPTFPEKLNFFKYACLFTFLMAIGHLKFEFTTTSINTHSSLQFCVFSIPLQAYSQKQRGNLHEKQQFEVLPQCLSLSHSMARTHGY